MAQPSKAQQLFDELLTRYGRAIAEAFQAAVEDLRANADLQRVIAAVQANDLDAAVAAMHLDPAALNGLQDAIVQAYTAGGQSAVRAMPQIRNSQGVAAVIRFDGRNPRAEQWLKTESSQLVTRILDDQRTAIRNALTAGMEKGQNPKTVALDIVGRVDRTTGKREGGVIGLTAQQEMFARTAADELASGDPEQLRNYLTRSRRDKRFDRTVQKAIDSGEPVPADIAGKAVRNYRNQLLRLRGEMIGRTEALTSLHAAQDEAYQQTIDAGELSASMVRNTWRSAGDSRVRHTHQIMNGETVGHGEAFTSPSGAKLRFPGDTALGAPASEIINCRCHVQKRIDFLANLD